MSKEIKKLEAVPKTLQGLRDACMDEINLLRSGESSIAKAKTVAYLSKQVISSVVVELTFNKPDKIKQLNVVNETEN